MGQANFYTQVKFGEQWSWSTQLLLERRLGRRWGILKETQDYEVVVPQLKLSWRDKEEQWSVHLGRMINPFGTFYQRQYLIDRDILSTPIAYSYYTNISEQFGLVADLAEGTRIPVEGGIDWGTPALYRLGYANGFKIGFSEAGKYSFQMAFLDRTPNVSSTEKFLANWAVIGRVVYQVNYFSKVGLSFSHGTFGSGGNQALSTASLNRYLQTNLGADFVLGTGFWEFRGELIASIYRVPEYLFDQSNFASGGSALKPRPTLGSGYLQIKYEWPQIASLYLAYRLEALVFNELEQQNRVAKWDNAVWRHSFGLGYKLTDFWQLKASFSTQSVAERNWSNEQRVFRLLTAFHW